MMQKRVIWCIVLTLVAFTVPTTAVFDEQTSYNWLQNNSQASLPVEELSYAITTLAGAGKQTGPLVTRLLAEKDTTAACWPKTACTIKDTALAYLALTTTSQDTEAVEQYLAQPNVLIPGVTTGEWRIQIESAFPGTCHVSWASGTKDFQVEADRILPTAGQYYINVAQDLAASLVTSQVNAPINVDCSEIAGALVISLVYVKGNNIYILQNIQSARATEANALVIRNGCYGKTIGATTCDYDTSLYATWAQVEAAKDIAELGTQTYLESALSNNELHRGVLARTLAASGAAKTYYFDQIRNSQAQDGSWSAGDALTTAFNIFALQQTTGYTDTVTPALEYLKLISANDGSWNQDIIDTAIALLAIKGTRIAQTTTDTTSTATTELCDDLMDNDNDGFIDCGDGDCDAFSTCDHCNNAKQDSDEEAVDCGGSACAACSQTTSAEFICYDNEDNDNDGDTDCDDNDCASDDSCAQEVEPTEEGPEIEEEQGNWWWILILLLLLIGGGGFFYMKYIKTGKVNFSDLSNIFKKKPKKPTFQEYVQQRNYQQPVQRPVQQQQPRAQPRPVAPTAKSKEDEELEKSLKEAEKLLRGQ